MAELWFYHLEKSDLERALPPLLEKCLQRGWRALVRAGSPERVDQLDSAIWTYRDDSFVTHGRVIRRSSRCGSPSPLCRSCSCSACSPTTRSTSSGSASSRRRTPRYYNTNAGGTTVEYDGFTVFLTAFALVNCGTQYHIKMAIADGGGTVFDSGVFLEAGSFTSTGNVIPTLAGGVGINGNTMLEGCNPVGLIFTRLGDTTDVDTVDIFITGTATPGVDYSPALPAQLIFPASQESISFILNVPIDADGPETMTITIEQLIDCAGIVIQTVFNFQIDSPPPLVVVPYDINGICNQTHLLDPA